MGQQRNIKYLRKVAYALKVLREGRCITQEDFYNDTGINIGRIERAVNDISLTTLLRICEYFEITPEEFFRRIK